MVRNSIKRGSFFELSASLTPAAGSVKHPLYNNKVKNPKKA